MRGIIWAVAFVAQVGTCLAQPVSVPTAITSPNHSAALVASDVAALPYRRMLCASDCLPAAADSYHSMRNPDLSRVGPDLFKVGPDLTAAKAR